MTLLPGILGSFSQRVLVRSGSTYPILRTPEVSAGLGDGAQSIPVRVALREPFPSQ